MVEDIQYIEVSVVIPCFRSQAALELLVARLASAMASRKGPYEVILVNDGSPDDTWSVIRDVAARHGSVRGFDLLYNTGQYRATLCGLQQARGDYVVTMDDDLQHSPEEVPSLVRALEARSDWDCVMAAFPAKRHGLLRRFGSAVMGRLFAALYGKPPGLQATSFRVLRRRLVEAVCAHGTVNPNINALIFQTTRRIGNLDVQHQPRPRGRSGYSLRRLAHIMADNVLSVSTLPLKCVSLLGLASAGGGLALGAYYLIRSLTVGFRAPGFATTVLLVIFFGGMILFSIGLLGEYIIRILEEVRGRPRYVLRDQVGPENFDSSRPVR